MRENCSKKRRAVRTATSPQPWRWNERRSSQTLRMLWIALEASSQQRAQWTTELLQGKRNRHCGIRDYIYGRRRFNDVKFERIVDNVGFWCGSLQCKTSRRWEVGTKNNTLRTGANIYDFYRFKVSVGL